MLDPTAGSGTTIVEAVLLRREAFGFDIDPLALRLCTVKTTWLDPRELAKKGLETSESACNHDGKFGTIAAARTGGSF